MRVRWRVRWQAWFVEVEDMVVGVQCGAGKGSGLRGLAAAGATGTGVGEGLEVAAESPARHFLQARKVQPIPFSESSDEMPF